MVALSRGCGGTLIAPDRVLTAGHCVEDLRISDLRLYVGATRRQRGGYRYDGVPVRAVEVASHPGYRPLENGGPVNDVAIVQLAAPVADVPPVRLAAAADGRRRRGQPGDGRRLGRDAHRPAPGAAGRRPAAGLAADPRRPPVRRSLRPRRQLPAQRDALRAQPQRRRRPNTSPASATAAGRSSPTASRSASSPSGSRAARSASRPSSPAWPTCGRSSTSPSRSGRPSRSAGATVTGSIRPGGTRPAWRPRSAIASTASPTAGASTASSWPPAGGSGSRATARGKQLQCRAVGVNAGGATPSLASPPLRVPRA
jgi:hypothetical protein